MEKRFAALVKRIAREQGVRAFEQVSRCRAFLNDYAKGAFKTEIEDFLTGLFLYGSYAKENRGAAAPALSRRLGAAMGPERARDVLAVLLPLFESDAPDAPARESAESAESADADRDLEALQSAARNGDYRAMYDLALFLESRGWHEEANYWLKKVAKQGLALYERASRDSAPRVAPDFVRVGGGGFMMGSPITEAGWSSEETQHRVHLTGFFLGKHPVTQQEYEEAAGANPSRFVGRRLPVENVNWFDAALYCNLRSRKEGLAPAYAITGAEVVWRRDAAGYRLPTEAEWEYACRAGTVTPFNTGSRITTEQANFNGTMPAARGIAGIFRGATTPVGTFRPNGWGLYDMHGNVYEWCWDWYGAYRIGLQRDPTGPATGSEKVIRGGCWSYSARSLRSASRSRDLPTHRGNGVGFRLLLPL